MVLKVGFEGNECILLIKEFVRSGVDYDQKGYIFVIVRGGMVTIHANCQNIFSVTGYKLGV